MVHLGDTLSADVGDRVLTQGVLVAMLPGPDLVLECPACGTPLRQTTISSGNTLDAVYYTDGYMDAPMLPQPVALLRCPSCRAPFVAREAMVMGQVDRFRANLFPDEAPETPADPAWKRAPRVAAALVTDYVAQLAARRFDREDEIELRVELMQLCNHPRRRLPRGMARLALSTVERANLGQLAARLDLRDPEEQVMLAEVWRELGEFEQAGRTLGDGLPGEVAIAAARIRQLIELQDPWVAEIFTGE